MQLRRLWLALLVLSPATAHATAASVIRGTLEDGVSLYTSPLRLTREDLPVTLGVATLLGGSLALDRITRHNLISSSTKGSANSLRQYGDVGQFMGPIVGGALAVHGWARDDAYEKRVSYELFDSFIWATALSFTFKIALGRKRPDVTDNPFVFKPGKSGGGFPSGHTTSAFAAAATLSEAYPTWKVQVPAYAAATAVAFSRIYSNKHWGSDVVGGALLGYGVAHSLWKRHQKGTTGWTLGGGPDGITLSRRY